MIEVIEIQPSDLKLYNTIPSRVLVKTILVPELVDEGLGGINLRENLVPQPYFKDYDTYGEVPSDWPKLFDVTNWAFFLAMETGQVIGGAAVAFDTTDVSMLEARRDLSVLWDIRVRMQGRGSGILLFRHAAEWSRTRGCRQMKIETQNVNVPACKFYQRMGASLGEIRCHGYANVPVVEDEVMLCWYLDLQMSKAGRGK
jgi:GNAT superfamily N-acetyltransferase